MAHLEARGFVKSEVVGGRLGSFFNARLVLFLVLVHEFVNAPGILFGRGGLLFQQIGLAEVRYLSVGEGLARHAEGEFLLAGVVQGLHQLGAEHHHVDAVGLADNVGIAGKGQPVLVKAHVARVHKVHRLDGIAHGHEAVFLQVLHRRAEKAVRVVGVVVGHFGDDAEFRHCRVVLDPVAVSILLIQTVGVAAGKILLDGGRGGLFDAPPLLVVGHLLGLAPPQKFPNPLCAGDGVLVARGVDPGKHGVGVGLLGEIEQIDAILNGLVDQTVCLEGLIAII